MFEPLWSLRNMTPAMYLHSLAALMKIGFFCSKDEDEQAFQAGNYQSGDNLRILAEYGPGVNGDRRYSDTYSTVMGRSVRVVVVGDEAKGIKVKTARG